MIIQKIALILFSTLVISSAYAGTKPTAITQAEFSDKVLTSDKFVVVTFFGSWCPSKDVSIDDMDFAEQDRSNIEFHWVDIVKDPELAKQHEIKGAPTIVYFKKGKDMGRTEGYMSKKEVIPKIKEMFEKCKNM